MSIVIKWYSSNGFVALSGGATSEDSLFYGSVSKSKYADELRDYARDRDGVVAGLSGGYVPSTPWPKQFYGGRVRSDFNFEDVATQNLARGEPSTIIVSNFPDVNKFWQAYDKASELKKRNARVNPNSLFDKLWENPADYDNWVEKILAFEIPKPKKQGWFASLRRPQPPRYGDDNYL